MHLSSDQVALACSCRQSLSRISMNNGRLKQQHGEKRPSHVLSRHGWWIMEGSNSIVTILVMPSFMTSHNTGLRRSSISGVTRFMKTNHLNDVLITNLITVYKHEHGLQGPALQVAGTTHEHLKAEHIIDGIGHTELCYNADAIYQCEVWYAEHQLPRGTTWPGRSGTSIVVHLLPAAPTGPVLLQLSACIQTHGRERQTHGQVAHTHGPRHMSDIAQSSPYRKNAMPRRSSTKIPHCSFRSILS